MIDRRKFLLGTSAMVVASAVPAAVAEPIFNFTSKYAGEWPQLDLMGHVWGFVRIVDESDADLRGRIIAGIVGTAPRGPSRHD